jgi:fluoride exporter
VNYLWIALGAIAGALTRYRIDLWAQSWNPHLGFPWGTFIINVSGSFLLGVFAALFTDSRQLSLFLMIGFCSSFTTFSTFSLEIVKLFQQGQPATALLYLGSSVVLGPLCCLVGYLLAHK